MPKIKTHKAAAKRFRLTGSGKVKRQHANHGHILTSKTKKRKNNLAKSALVSNVDTPRVKRMLGLH